jgi:hypothetical protein
VLRKLLRPGGGGVDGDDDGDKHGDDGDDDDDNNNNNNDDDDLTPACVPAPLPPLPRAALFHPLKHFELL